MNWIKIREHTYYGTKYDVVKATVLIRENSTGEIVEYISEEWLGVDEITPSVFNWAENNYSCDCNRRIFFQRTKGIEYQDCEDTPCSDGLFSVNIKNTLTGEFYYKEY